jgi:hypothetical protein
MAAGTSRAFPPPQKLPAPAHTYTPRPRRSRRAACTQAGVLRLRTGCLRGSEGWPDVGVTEGPIASGCMAG